MQIVAPRTMEKRDKNRHPMKTIANKIHEGLASTHTVGEIKALTRIIATELLGISQTAFYLADEIKLDAEQTHLLTNAIERLQQHEPIQYILGYSDFCGLRFAVTPAVLIPRPETSELIEWIATESSTAKSILDIGTGSGCIAVSLATMMPQARVTAWDISTQALAVAQKNSTANDCNVLFEERDILTYEPTEEKYDVIVSNPPYIKEVEKKEMEENVLLWEPHLALFVPDSDPLLFYRTIAEKAQKMLTPGGYLFFEINREHGADTVAMLQTMNYRNIALRKDLAGNDRMVMAEKQ